jgi:hypothetical protein
MKLLDPTLLRTQAFVGDAWIDADSGATAATPWLGSDSPWRSKGWPLAAGTAAHGPDCAARRSADEFVCEAPRVLQWNARSCSLLTASS